jgi:hypothetical protein
MPSELELGVYDPSGEEYHHGPQAEFLSKVYGFKATNDAHVAKTIRAGGDPRRDHRPLQYLHFV